MTNDQIDALLGYLEFSLLSFVEEHERHITDVDVVGSMYDKAYAMLNDFETTLVFQQQDNVATAIIAAKKKNN